MATYRIAIGLNYENKRAEPGDVVDDLPENAISDLLAMGAIVEVPAPRPPTKRGSKA